MIKIRNTRHIMILFLAFALFSFLFSEKITNAIVNMNPILILFLVPLLNPIYLIFIWSLGKEYGFKGVIGSFLIALAVTIVSIPRYITNDGTEFSEGFIPLIADLNVWKLIPNFLKFDIGGINFGSILLYFGVSIGLMILALMILHKKHFKQIFLNSS